MRGQGRVYAINPTRGMVAIEIDANDFTIIEISGAEEVEVGDQIVWDDDWNYRNVTKGAKVHAHEQNRSVTLAGLRQQLLLE